MPSGHVRGAAGSCVAVHPVRTALRKLRRVILILSSKTAHKCAENRGRFVELNEVIVFEPRIFARVRRLSCKLLS
jgi:hypothetical protein